MANRRFVQRLGNQGFTLMEMVIVVVVLAVLLSITTPSLFRFLSMRDSNNEDTSLLEIRKAMQAYLADKGELPDDGSGGASATAWATALAGYTNLSQAQILKDQWGRDRRYLVFADTTRNIMGSPVKVYYATVMSLGGDGKASAKDKSGNTITGLAVTTGSSPVFDSYSATGWWKNTTGAASAKVNAFAQLSSGGDDQMVRFTDYPQKLEAYNNTVDRMDRISQALETYARSGYSQLVTACGSAPKDSNGNVVSPASASLIYYCNNGRAEKTVFYPKATAVYSASDSADYYDTTTYVNNNQNDTNRRTDMVKLMRLLGLPDDFCCSAVDFSSTDKQPEPFFYFSNPRPRLPSTGCGTRPNATTNKLPARLTTTNTTDNPGSGTVPTCG